MITHHMYMGQFVDEKKVDDSAFKRANDRYKPSDVLVHYHTYNESCTFRENIPEKLDKKHKLFVKEVENV